MSRAINWNYPEPNKGLKGYWDKFVGPGASLAENALTLVSASVAAAALIFYQYAHNLNWSGWQQLLAIFITFDLVGGVVANSHRSAKRWYHRHGQSAKHHLNFVATHILQIILVAWAFAAMNWSFVAIAYSALLISALVVIFAPAQIQRSVALLMASLGVVLQCYVLLVIPGFEWFIPVLFIKLLTGHLVYEEPYE